MKIIPTVSRYCFNLIKGLMSCIHFKSTFLILFQWDNIVLSHCTFSSLTLKMKRSCFWSLLLLLSVEVFLDMDVVSSPESIIKQTSGALGWLVTSEILNKATFRHLNMFVCLWVVVCGFICADILAVYGFGAASLRGRSALMCGCSDAELVLLTSQHPVNTNTHIFSVLSFLFFDGSC